MPRRGVAKLQFHLPTFTSREGPSVRKATLAGTCSESRSIFAA